MPPRVKVTKEDIVKTALDLVRTGGAEAINARAIAKELNCSTQPIFSNFSGMDELKCDLTKRANKTYREYMQREIQRGEYPAYKASGMAYIRFAKEEPQLFHLLYMRDRSAENMHEENELNNQMLDYVRLNTGLSGDEAKLFHLEVWAFVHGIASMLATDFLDLDWDLVSKMLTDAYQGLKKQHSMV